MCETFLDQRGPYRQAVQNIFGSEGTLLASCAKNFRIRGYPTGKLCETFLDQRVPYWQAVQHVFGSEGTLLASCVKHFWIRGDPTGKLCEKYLDQRGLISIAVGSDPLRAERCRREASREIFTTPKLVTARRSILGQGLVP